MKSQMQFSKTQLSLLLIHPQFSPITAIKLFNCFKVTLGLLVKSLSGFLPLRQRS